MNNQGTSYENQSLYLRKKKRLFGIALKLPKPPGRDPPCCGTDVNHIAWGWVKWKNYTDSQ